MIDAGAYSAFYNASENVIQLYMGGGGGGVPEPSAWLLLLLGLGGVFAVRKSTRKA